MTNRLLQHCPASATRLFQNSSGDEDWTDVNFYFLKPFIKPEELEKPGPKKDRLGNTGGDCLNLSSLKKRSYTTLDLDFLCIS